MTPQVDPDDVSEVREAFIAAEFTPADRLSPSSALLASIFVDRHEVRIDVLMDQALPVAAMKRLGLLSVKEQHARAHVRVEPIDVPQSTSPTARVGRAGWLVSDFLGAKPLRPDHVLGAGGAAATLTDITVREPVGSALDLGTGGGIQLVHLAAHTQRLTGTDTNSRALQLAALTLGLSGVNAELLAGDRFKPVEQRQFDLIVSNPPMVIGPSRQLEYRDSGLEGDAMSRSIVSAAPRYLTDGGTCQLLAHWLHVGGTDWRESVASWLPTTDVDSWVVQREALDPREYVDLWLDDSGQDSGGVVRERWLAWFAERGIEAVGMGWIALRRTGSAAPSIRLEDLRQSLEQPVGLAVTAHLGATALLRLLSDEEILSRPWSVADGVRLDQQWRAEAGDWQAENQSLRQLRGMRRVVGVDGAGAAVLGACDGLRPLRHILGQVATDFVVDESALQEGFLAAFRGLIELGFVEAPRPPD